MMDLIHPALHSTALSHGEYGVIQIIDILFFFKNCFTISALWIDALSQHVTSLFLFTFHRSCSFLIVFRYSINILALESSFYSKGWIVFKWRETNHEAAAKYILFTKIQTLLSYGSPAVLFVGSLRYRKFVNIYYLNF